MPNSSIVEQSNHFFFLKLFVQTIFSSISRFATGSKGNGLSSKAAAKFIALPSNLKPRNMSFSPFPFKRLNVDLQEEYYRSNPIEKDQWIKNHSKVRKKIEKEFLMITHRFNGDVWPKVTI